MAQTIKIKRSSTTVAPSSLASGELAYSTASGAQKLYYGDGNDVLAIGGKSYTDKLDNIEAYANVTDTANVTAAGALMDSEVTNLAQVKAFDSSDYVLNAGSTLTGNLNFNDNVKAKFGTGGDMELFHDGNNSIIKDSGDGILRYTSSNSTNQGVVLEVENTDSTNLSGSFIHFKDSLGITPAKIGALSNEMYLMRGSNNDRILVTNASAVELYHSDVKKFETYADGIEISDNAKFPVNGKAIFNTNFEIYRDASNAIISETGAGSLILRGTNLSLQSDDNDQYIQCIENGGVTIYHQDSGNSSPKLVTKSDGVDITGELQSDSLDVDGNADISGDLTVGGDLNITGNVNSHNVTDLDVTDKTITVGAGQASAASANSGLVVGGSDARFLYSGTKFEIDQGNGTLSAVLTASNFGSEYTGSLDGGTF